MQTASFYHMLSVIYLLIIARTIVLVQIDFLFQFVLNHDMLLFTPFSITRFAMHRIYATRINSRGMSRAFYNLRYLPITPYLLHRLSETYFAPNHCQYPARNSLSLWVNLEGA